MTAYTYENTRYVHHANQIRRKNIFINESNDWAMHKDNKEQFYGGLLKLEFSLGWQGFEERDQVRYNGYVVRF